MVEMRSEHQQTMENRLQTLAKRIETRVAELKERGEFTSLHDEAAQDLKEKHAALRGKLDKAVGERKFWEILKDEMELDLESLGESLRHWEERLDTETMRSRS